MHGEAGNDTLTGNVGADRLVAGAGDDQLDGGKGDDLAYGGAGDDQLSGGDGNDLLAAGAGDDELMGGAGTDKLFGEAGDDELFGGAGADTLSGGAGDDELSGGQGNDLFLFNGGGGNDVIMDLEDGDLVRIAKNINGSGITSASQLADRLPMTAGMRCSTWAMATRSLWSVSRPMTCRPIPAGSSWFPNTRIRSAGRGSWRSGLHLGDSSCRQATLQTGIARRRSSCIDSAAPWRCWFGRAFPRRTYADCARG